MAHEARMHVLLVALASDPPLGPFHCMWYQSCANRPLQADMGHVGQCCRALPCSPSCAVPYLSRTACGTALHRTTVVDDARGVGEPLKETMCGCTACICPAGGLAARGRHLLVPGPAVEAAARLRSAAQRLNDPAILAFSALGSESIQRESVQRVGRLSWGEAAAAGAADDDAVTGGSSGRSRAGRNVEKPAAARGASSTAAKGSTLPAVDWWQQHPQQQPQLQREQSPAQRLQKQPQEQAYVSSVVAALGLRGRWSALAPALLAQGGLPPNVHLLSLMQADEGSPTRLILRLAHIFQVR